MKCSNWIKTQNPKDDFEGMIKHLFMASTPAKKKKQFKWSTMRNKLAFSDERLLRGKYSLQLKKKKCIKYF